MGRRIWLGLAAAVALCLAISGTALAKEADLQLAAKGAVLLDGVSGQTLYEQNADERCYPASVTKLMTLTLILEAAESGKISMNDMVTTSEAAAEMGGSQVYLYAGETRTVDEMLIAIAVGSGNDAAYAMAEFVGGSMENFVEMMNARAGELGLTGTHFVNPHGLHDDEHYTTAADMARLAYHAIQVPHLLEYTSIYEYQFRPEPKPLVLWNTNRLLKWYDDVDGLKTGYTEEGGRSIVATASREGMRLIAVVLGSAERKGHFTEAMKLLNYGFNNFEYFPLYSEGQVVEQIAVSKGQTDTVDVVVDRAIGYMGQRGEQAEISTSIELNGQVTAPVEAGQAVGTITVIKNSQPLAEAKLLTAGTVEKGGLTRIWHKLLCAMGFAKL